MGEMRLKVTIALTIVLALGDPSLAGVLRLEGEPIYGQQEPVGEAYHVPQGSFASSYMQFRGPVEGHEYEVKMPGLPDQEQNKLYHQLYKPGDLKEEHAVDYVSKPKYEYSYAVEDHHTGDFYQKKETRDGGNVSGEYTLKEPDGSVRVVKYHADESGFHAVVHNTGKNDQPADIFDKQSQAHGQEHQFQTNQGHD